MGYDFGESVPLRSDYKPADPQKPLAYLAVLRDYAMGGAGVGEYELRDDPSFLESAEVIWNATHPDDNDWEHFTAINPSTLAHGAWTYNPLPSLRLDQNEKGLSEFAFQEFSNFWSQDDFRRRRLAELRDADPVVISHYARAYEAYRQKGPHWNDYTTFGRSGWLFESSVPLDPWFTQYYTTGKNEEECVDFLQAEVQKYNTARAQAAAQIEAEQQERAAKEAEEKSKITTLEMAVALRAESEKTAKELQKRITEIEKLKEAGKEIPADLQEEYDNAKKSAETLEFWNEWYDTKTKKETQLDDDIDLGAGNTGKYSDSLEHWRKDIYLPANASIVDLDEIKERMDPPPAREAEAKDSKDSTTPAPTTGGGDQTPPSFDLTPLADLIEGPDPDNNGVVHQILSADGVSGISSGLTAAFNNTVYGWRDVRFGLTRTGHGGIAQAMEWAGLTAVGTILFQLFKSGLGLGGVQVPGWLNIAGLVVIGIAAAHMSNSDGPPVAGSGEKRTARDTPRPDGLALSDTKGYHLPDDVKGRITISKPDGGLYTLTVAPDTEKKIATQIEGNLDLAEVAERVDGDGIYDTAGPAFFIYNGAVISFAGGKGNLPEGLMKDLQGSKVVPHQLDTDDAVPDATDVANNGFYFRVREPAPEEILGAPR